MPKRPPGRPLRESGADREAAIEKAQGSGLNVAIRKVKEFGKVRFNVSFACHMDSDYFLAEIVTLSDNI